MFRHRSGPLKQQNKSHKHGRHRTKSEISNSRKSKVGIKVITQKFKHHLKKIERKNQSIQLRKKKRMDLLNSKRMIGDTNSAPLLIFVLNNSNENIVKLVNYIKDCHTDVVINYTQRNSMIVILPSLKVRYQFIFPSDDLFYNLDASKLADILLIVHPNTFDGFYSLDNDEFLNSIYSYNLPTTVHVAFDMDDSLKKRQQIKKDIQKAIERKFPDEKLYCIDKSSDLLQIFHLIKNCKKRRLIQREFRSSILIDSYDYDSAKSNLIVRGYVRNAQLNVNNLLYIPGHENFQMEWIKVIDDPNKWYKNNSMFEIAERMLLPDPMIRESLKNVNDIDPMDGEQTLLTPEEHIQLSESKKKVVKVPKGTSDYQAAWIIDENESDNGFENSEDEEDECELEIDKMDESLVSEDEESEEELESIRINENSDEDEYNDKMNLDEEKETLLKFRKEREQELFPDEIDTPQDVAARIRFARYRGLKSFVHSPWDKKENLPLDYSKIFQFENFALTRKRVINKSRDCNEEMCAQVGDYVEICLSKVDIKVIEDISREVNLMSMFALLPHEQKMSVLNVAIKKHKDFDEPIQSKEELIFHLGFRRFVVKPIFSCHTNGDKFKMERFLNKDRVSVATFFGPITFPPASALVYKKCGDEHRLIATGSLLSVNPDRIVIKRIRLSGHPFKIMKKSAVVRYMFFNREDILWFKSVELRTKYGRKGHIKEPLGTHGHMKCTFDRPLTSNDTVMLNLYKRVYPKWSYCPFVSRPINEIFM